VVVLQAVVLTLALATVADQGTSPQTPAPATPAAAVPVPAAANRPHEDMAGSWSYNPDQSVNAATGRPETLRAANERRGGGGGGGGGGATGGGGPRGGPGGPSIGPGYGAGADGRPLGGGYDGPPSVAFSMMQQSRDTVRDLMEIAPRLTVAVSSTNVTFTDDLNRTLVFPTDGKKQKYQLGAAIFDAKTYWDGSQLKMDIEGPNSLKMSETFLLSEDGSRLFVLIRIGEQIKGERPVGVNRVYDRTVK
jgi:hypothetical protein